MKDNIDFKNTMLENEEYNKHCLQQKDNKVTIMCAPIDRIRNKTANDLLKMSNQNETVPTNLNCVLNSVGISALPYDFTEMEKVYLSKAKDCNEVSILGAIVMDKDNAAIFYNEKDELDSHRCRFTIAHELGHCCLSHPCIQNTYHIEFRTDGIPLNEEEKAANVFAGELLIPYEELLKVINRLLIPSVHTLASIFDVSDNVMFKRLEYLKITNNISGYNY